MAISDLQKTTGPKVRKGPWCTVCEALETLPEADAAGLRALLADRTWRYSALSNALRNDPDTPMDIPAFTLANHARGQCAARERLR